MTLNISPPRPMLNDVVSVVMISKGAYCFANVGLSVCPSVEGSNS